MLKAIWLTRLATAPYRLCQTEALVFVVIYFLKVLRYLIREEKKSGKSDWIFPRLSFSRPEFFSDLFSPDKEFIPIFFQLLLLMLLFFFPIYLQNLLLPCFFDVLYLSWLSKAVLTKISKCEWKQGIEKNNNNNDINTTRNCTFVKFKNFKNQ